MINPLRPAERQEITSSRQSDPFGLTRLRDQMDRLFENTLRDFGLSIPVFSDMMFRPSINVSETDKDVCVSVDVPGVSPDDIEVSIDDDTLIIRGERKEERVDENERMYHVERMSGRFERRVVMPESVEKDKVDATYDNGVLTVTVPKAPREQREMKKIKVRTAQPAMTGGESSQKPQTAAAGSQGQSPQGKSPSKSQGSQQS